MSSQYEERLKALENQLMSNEQEPDLLRRLSKNIRLVRGAMEAMAADREFMTRYFFEEATQIEYNKERLPVLLSKLIFFCKYLTLEIFLLHVTGDKAVEFCESELAATGRFFIEHKDFCAYCFSDDTAEDPSRYSSKNIVNEPIDFSEPTPSLFHHPGCQLKSMLLACQEYRRLLRAKLENLSAITANTKRGGERISFEGQQVDLAELLLALYEAETVFVDGQPAKQEFLFQQVAAIFSNIEAGKLQGLIKNVRDRKGGPAKYLLRLVAALDGRMTRAFTESPRKTPLKHNRLK